MDLYKDGRDSKSQKSCVTCVTVDFKLPIMKVGLLSTLLVTAATAAPTAQPRFGGNGYEGYKVLRMETGGHLEQVKKLLSDFQYDEWTHDASKYIDFSISPDQAKKLKELGASFKEIHSDLGKDIDYESKPCDYKGMNQPIPPATPARADISIRKEQDRRATGPVMV